MTVIVLMVALTSCVYDELSIKNDFNGNEDLIRISAFVIPTEQTRSPYLSSDKPEQVSSGIWYFTYPKQSNLTFDNTPYGTALVDFGASLEDPTVGFAKFINSNNEEKDLKWKHIWDNGSTSSRYYYFYLHNIKPEFFDYTYEEDERKRSYQKITFKENSPFREIRPLDKENGTNDIITGVCNFWSSDKNKNFIFNLEHRLALFKLNIEVYGAKSDNHVINLSNATVTISNLYSGLESFSISSPASFAATPSTSNQHYTGKYFGRKLFTIKGDVNKGEYQWDGNPEVDENYKYEDDIYKKVTYKSLEFVVPPQSISLSYVPIIVVKVPKEDVTGSANDKGDFVEYTGILPSSMFNVKDPNTGELDPSPIELAFKEGSQLTVTATINSPETELYFSPVKVESWISKGSFTINTNQAGIYNLDDFKNMVNAYNAGDKAQLEKFGYTTSDGTFIIQFWNNVELPEYLDISTPLAGCVKLSSKINFAFLFNGCLIKLLAEDGVTVKEELDSSPGQVKLYNIVTGQNENYTGIGSADDFMAILEICSEELTPDIKDLLKYGYLSNSDNSLILDVTQTFDIPIEQFFQKMPSSFGGYNVSLQFNNNASINLVFPEKDKKLEINIFNQSRYLEKLMFIPSTYGMWEVDDFFMLKEFYNEYCQFYPDILKVFGTYNESSSTPWTFYFRNNMNIQGKDFFYSMIPDSENGKPQFTFSGSYKNGNSNSYYTLTIEDEFTPCSLSLNSTNINYYTCMVQGSGKARYSNNNNLSYVVSHYNTNNYYNLWYYGHFDRATKKWIFPLYYDTSSVLSTTWSTIYGKIVPEEISGKYDYEFDFTGVTKEYEVQKAPKSATDSSTGATIKLTPDETGAEALKQICLGTYWEWLEQQNER